MPRTLHITCLVGEKQLFSYRTVNNVIHSRHYTLPSFQEILFKIILNSYYQITLVVECFLILIQVYFLVDPESAKCVQRFDDSQVMQFTLLIAIHCVLHRCKSQEIHC